MLLALISLFQTTPPLPAPPLTPPAPPAPPMIMPRAFGEGRPGLARALPRYVIDIDAAAGGKTLWHGTLRLGLPGGANFQRSLTEAPPENCAPGESPYSGARDSFRIQLNAFSRDEDTPRQSFSVDWQRPSEQCADAVATRSVQLSGTLELKPGQSVTVEGDAGLKVRFSRR